MSVCNPRRAWPALIAAILLGNGVADCDGPQSGADLDRRQECSRQADQEFNKQNRYQLSEQDQSSTPFSSSGLIGVPNRGLSDQYRRDRMVDDCLHSTLENEPTILPGRS